MPLKCRLTPIDSLAGSLPVDDVDCTASTAEGCDPADGMPQDEVLAGPYQYHGGDRYETDLIDMDKLLRPDGGQPAPGAGRSTGFVHVGVRYYEPATGRFLQHDPMFIDPTPFAWGQHKRWVYCANDPVNYFDFDGQALDELDIAIWIAGHVSAWAGAVHIWGGAQWARDTRVAMRGWMKILGQMVLVTVGVTCSGRTILHIGVQEFVTQELFVEILRHGVAEMAWERSLDWMFE